MDLLTQSETAEETRLSERTLERHRLAGTGPQFVRLGRRVLYRREDVEEWIAANICRSTSEADAMAGRCGETEAEKNGDLVGKVEGISAGIPRQDHEPDDPHPHPPWAAKATPFESKRHRAPNKFGQKSSTHRGAEGAA